ncbi:MAG TPA: class I SAM-dependent methyltransferase [Pyrinomonadaceae bacterium]|jgi:SAM-dependent methyltransferase|nr:class I SAM-dependent methyltransferase [Pyrinomonadaceae bacterium]
MNFWNKPCEVEDFADPALAGVMRRVFPRDAAAADWPRGREYRKRWEVAMAVLAAETFLGEGRRGCALGVGAGTEATSFYLTNLFRWVFATDLYASAGWPQDSPPAMLSEPARFADGTPFRLRRLVVQHMDARELSHEDETFDFIYSCGSVEHFGTREQIARACAEMGRVLKPGGVIAISTEFCARGESGYLVSDTLLLGAEDLRELIVKPTGCAPLDELRFKVSEATLGAPVPWEDAIRDRVNMQHRPDMAWSQYPHILLDDGLRAWTSYHVTLRKPG